jgi:hypothetical protein
MSRVWQWIVQNKVLLFDGMVGSALLAVCAFLLKKLFPSHTPQVIVPPTISPTFDFSQRPSASKALERPTLPPPQERRPPEVESLTPRICSVEEQRHFGLIESGKSFIPRAVVATFRTKKLSSDNRSPDVTARLLYRSVEMSKDIHRVNHGMWLGETYNSAKINFTDTKEVVLLVQRDGCKCIAIQDNRHDLSKYNEPTIFEFPSALESVYVDVTLVDDRFGALITYTYEIHTKPLGVYEIIRGGR